MKNQTFLITNQGFFLNHHHKEVDFVALPAMFISLVTMEERYCETELELCEFLTVHASACDYPICVDAVMEWAMDNTPIAVMDFLKTPGRNTGGVPDHFLTH